MRKDKEEEREHKKTNKEKDSDKPRYAKTTYPSDYRPPKIDSDPEEIHQTKRHQRHYDSEYHTGPFPTYDKKERSSYDGKRR